MSMDWAGVFADAWRRWKRDHHVIVPLAGLFLFLPQYAFLLLAPPLPKLPADKTADLATMLEPGSPIADWMTHNAPAMLVMTLLTAFGSLVLLSLFLGGERLTPGTALKRSLGLFPRYLLAAIVTGLAAAPIEFGALILVLPGLYLMGRLMLVAPAIVAERPIGVGKAIARSFALTRGKGLVMMGIAGLAILMALVLPQPFRLIHHAMASGNASNPVAVAIVEFVGSALAAAVTTATLLVEIAIYRRLSASSSGA